MGCDGIDIRKVKGHATEADVEAGRSTPWERDCNDHADHFAKRGVEVAEAQLPSDILRARYREARAWYSWLAELIGHWPADTQDRSTQRAEAARRPAPRRMKGLSGTSVPFRSMKLCRTSSAKWKGPCIAASVARAQF